MRWIQSLGMRLRALARSDAVDRDLADEIDAHLAHSTQENMSRGMSAEDARSAALREFGPVHRVVDDSRDARGITWIVNAIRDLRYGVRLMRRSPGLAATTMLTVALGIGATTAMFSVVYGVLLRPLPYRDAGRLVDLWTTAPKRGLPRAYVGMANVRDWRARNHVFEDIAALRPIANFNLTENGEPERLNGARVSANLFPVLGVTPLVGRTFTEDEEEIGHEQVALLSYGLWKRRFAGDRGVVGGVVRLNGVPHTVVGVMRQDFAFPTRDYQIWTPLTFDPSELVDRMNYSYTAVGRLKSGVTLAQARAEMSAIASNLEREYPRTNDGIGTEVVPMTDDAVDAVRTPLYMLLAAVGAMLLVGCANLANLLLARALVRHREIAMRAALGAGSGRLIAESIAELVPMLAIGGAVGLAAAAWTIRAVVPALPPDLPRAENIALDVPVLLFSSLVLGAIAIFVGIWPALDVSRGRLSFSITDVSRGVAGGAARRRRRDVLVVAQIGVTLWLVVAAALLARSFAALRQVDPGFNPRQVYSLHLAIPRSKYPKDVDVASFSARLMDRVRALPDVVSVAMVNRLPLAGGTQTGAIEFEGVDPARGPQQNTDWRTVTPDYFRTLQIPLRAGRTFTEADDERTQPVAIVDEQLARAVFGTDQILGRRVRIPVANQPWLTVVGVVGHIRHDRLDADTRPQVYWNYRQRTQDRMAMAVRTRGDADAVAPSIVAAIRAEDAEQPVYDARSLDAVVDRSLAQRWLQTTLVGAFASIALLLASVGVYGVIAYSVGQRQREFGIRLALGARGAELVRLVVRHGLVLFAAGAAAGMVAAAGTARALASVLFNVSAFDLPSFAFAAGLLFVVAIVACALPARLAARVDVTVILKGE